MNARTVIVAAAVTLGLAGVTNAMPQAAAAPKKAAATKAPAAKAPAGLKLTDLPAAVRAAVETETRGATLKGISKEKENGKVVYEVETTVDGRSRDLMIDATGKVYDVEEQLDIANAPAAVRSAIETRGQLLSLEKATTNGKVHYEGQVRTKAGKKVAFDLAADGKPIAK
jgi:uncharacterized membrane protein YkoI